MIVARPPRSGASARRFRREVGEHQSAVCLERPHVLPRCPHVAVALRNRIHDDDVEAAGAVELGASEDRCPRARRRQPPDAVGAVAAVGALGRGCRFPLIGHSGAGHAIDTRAQATVAASASTPGSAEEHPAATPARSGDQTIHRRIASSKAGRDSATAAHVSAMAAPTAAPTMTGSPAGWAT